MNALLIYLAKSALSFGILFAVYWFFLRKDTFFGINRYFLLSSMAFSLFFPLVPLHWTPSSPPAAVRILMEPVPVLAEPVNSSVPQSTDWTGIALTIYLTGLAIFLIRFLVQVAQLTLMIWRSGISEYQGNRVVFIDRLFAPFSFFRLIFISRRTLEDTSLQTILEHEQVHIRQRHSLDLLLSGIVTSLQWFNPAAWLAGRELRSIHEYLADDGVLQNGISPSRYQLMILGETMGVRVNELTNHFNVSLLKKRIVMMTRSKSGEHAKVKVLIVIPAVAALSLLLTARSNNIQFPPDIVPSSAVEALVIPSPEPQKKKQQEEKIKFVAPVVQDKPFTVVEKQPSFVGGEQAMQHFLQDNIKYPEQAIKSGLHGTVYISFIVKANGEVDNVKILRGIGGGCDEEAVRVVKLMPAWNPGLQKGKPVDVVFNLPVKFMLDSHKKDKKVQ